MSLRVSGTTTATRTTPVGLRCLAAVALSNILLFSAAQATWAATEPTSPDEQSDARKPSRWEFLVASGTLLPTGTQRGDIRRAEITSVQLTYVAQPQLAITTALGWARSRDVAVESSPRLNIFSYDIGAEFRPFDWADDRKLAFRPFAGVGAGGRSYDYPGADIDARHHIAGYLSAGGEFGNRRFRLRFEVRNYLSGFTSVHEERSSVARNDVVAMLGLRILKRQN